jgi:hypothetical protein
MYGLSRRSSILRSMGFVAQHRPVLSQMCPQLRPVLSASRVRLRSISASLRLPFGPGEMSRVSTRVARSFHHLNLRAHHFDSIRCTKERNGGPVLGAGLTVVGLGRERPLGRNMTRGHVLSEHTRVGRTYSRAVVAKL